MYRGHQKVLSSHNHNLPLLPPQKFEKLILFDSHGLSLLTIHSPLELDNCYHQTEHESTGLLSCCQLSDDRHTLCKVEKKNKDLSDLISIITTLLHSVCNQKFDIPLEVSINHKKYTQPGSNIFTTSTKCGHFNAILLSNNYSTPTM